MPHSLDAERSVLGAVMIDNEALAVAASVVTAEMFYRDAHRRIWRRMLALTDANEPIDFRTLSEALERSKELEEVGGPIYVGGLVDGVPRATNVDAYARIVKEKATLRELILASNQTISDAYAAVSDADEILDDAERRVMEIGRRTVKGDFVLAEDWAREMFAAVEYSTQHKSLITGVPAGLPRLDRFTRGWQPKDLVYIGARPSTGKTALMIQMALWSADHVMTGIVSVEMSRKDIGLRAIAMLAGVDLYQLQTGYLSQTQQARVGQAIEELARKQLAIDDAAGLTDAQLRAKVRRLASKHGLGIVFVDYFQLLRHGGERAENRNLEVAEMSRGLKALAKELGVPLIVLSQLNRDSDKGNRRPRMSDLRDGGSLEQDADAVLLLHRSSQHEEGARYQDGEKAELIIAKQRNGPTGTVDLQWFGPQARFREPQDTTQPETAHLPMEAEA
jgi:replicative DNA helicase